MGQSITITFTKADQDLILWVNMLIEHDMRPTTWIQAILLSEKLTLGLDAGGVFVPGHDPGHSIGQPSKPGLQMFGDDTEAEDFTGSREEAAQAHRHQEIGVESKIKIRVTRKAVENIVIDLKARRKKVSPYVKAALRKHIRRLTAGPNQPPDPLQIVDLFTLYEDQFLDARAPTPNKGCTKEQQGRREAHSPVPKAEGSGTEASRDPGDPSPTPSRKKNPLLQYIG